MIRVKLRRKAVEEYLYDRNMTQSDLARGLGVSAGYLSQLLSGTRCPSPRLRARLLRKVKADRESLFEPVTGSTAGQ